MTKNKLKLSLIEDYIKIVLIKNFFRNSFEGLNLSEQDKQVVDCSKNLNQILFSTYELLFERLKLNNLSLDILKQELEQNNLMFLEQKSLNFKGFKEVCTKNLNQLSEINSNLKPKLEKLKIKPINLFCKNSL